MIDGRMPTHVPLSPLVQPPDGALYVPLAEFPSALTVPEKTTTCPLSFKLMVMEPLAEIVPVNVAVCAHMLPATDSWPESEPPL